MSTQTPLNPASESNTMLRVLDASYYRHFMAPMRTLDMNTLFARAVLEQGAPGMVFVDSAESPSVIYVAHDYGMSLLFAATERADLNDRVIEHVMRMPRTKSEWLQVAPADWADRFAKCSARNASAGVPHPKVEQFTRVNFKFSPEAFRARRPCSWGRSCRVVRVDRSTFAMQGSVVPRAFWCDVEQFLDAGAGFAVLVDGELASLAFSGFVTCTQLEIGIETLERHRGRGLATLACVALIDHCLARGLEPVWACRLENTASHRLAESLGFLPVRHLPYFQLSPSIAQSSSP